MRRNDRREPTHAMNRQPERPTRAAVYARVSTSDKDQNVETQLLPLREFVRNQGWQVFLEYIDQAPATDLNRRTQWRELLSDASKRKFDLVLVWRMDRAFRSVLDAATTLERFRGWGVGLRSYSEPWLDTTSPFGEALFHITIAYAQLERGILRERVKAGMERARKEGKQIGRPSVYVRKGFRPRLQNVLERLDKKEISRRQAAKELKVGYATLKRILDKREGNSSSPPADAAPEAVGAAGDGGAGNFLDAAPGRDHDAPSQDVAA
ncbi:MAG: recombinase family protein [SAR202 cluster bacterium]|nr:recombinase family protein [SAR202 cluster bacterium]